LDLPENQRFVQLSRIILYSTLLRAVVQEKNVYHICKALKNMPVGLHVGGVNGGLMLVAGVSGLVCTTSTSWCDLGDVDVLIAIG
jgi:hypothetical protein